MSKEIVKVIGSNSFRLTRIPVFESIRISGELQRIFGPAVASLGAAAQSGTEGSINFGLLSSVLMDSAEALGRNLDGETLVYVVKMLIRQDSTFVRAEGKTDYVRVGPDEIQLYIDSIEEMFELALAILQHNYSEAFSKAVARFTNVGMKFKPKAGTAPETTEAEVANPLDA